MRRLGYSFVPRGYSLRVCIETEEMKAEARGVLLSRLEDAVCSVNEYCRIA